MKPGPTMVAPGGIAPDYGDGETSGTTGGSVETRPSRNSRSVPPFEAVYAGEREAGGVDYYDFVGVDRAFVLGVPEDRVGVTFEIKLLLLPSNGFRHAVLRTYRRNLARSLW